MKPQSNDAFRTKVERLARKIGKKTFDDREQARLIAEVAIAAILGDSTLSSLPEDVQTKRVVELTCQRVRAFKVLNSMDLIEAVTRRVLGNGPDAEDAAQGTSLRLLLRGSITWISNPRNLLAFVAVAAKFGAIGEGRQQARRNCCVTCMPCSTLTGIPNGERTIPDRVADKELVQETLSKMPKDYVDVLLLNGLDGFTVEEIAAWQRDTRGAISGILQRSKKRFRDLWRLGSG